MVSLPGPCVFQAFTVRRGRLTGIGTRFGGARRPVGHFKSPELPRALHAVSPGHSLSSPPISD
jgi:hypothetical protein